MCCGHFGKRRRGRQGGSATAKTTGAGRQRVHSRPRGADRVDLPTPFQRLRCAGGFARPAECAGFGAERLVAACLVEILLRSALVLVCLVQVLPHIASNRLIDVLLHRGREALSTSMVVPLVPGGTPFDQGMMDGPRHHRLIQPTAVHPVVLRPTVTSQDPTADERIAPVQKSPSVVGAVAVGAAVGRSVRRRRENSDLAGHMMLAHTGEDPHAMAAAQGIGRGAGDVRGAVAALPQVIESRRAVERDADDPSASAGSVAADGRCRRAAAPVVVGTAN